MGQAPGGARRAWTLNMALFNNWAGFGLVVKSEARPGPIQTSFTYSLI